MAEVVVVGGGLAGAASAARLAKLGHQVTVVERLPRLGGAVGFVEADGFRWDSGPHATALPAVLRDLFRKSGRPLERELELEPVDPIREHRFPDGSRVALGAGSRAAQMAAVDAGLGPGLGRQWVDHVHEYAAPWAALRRDVLERPYSPGLLSDAGDRLLRSRRTLHRAVSRRFRDPRLRALAVHHAVTAGQDPRRVPAWLGMVDYLEASFGAWTFAGGLGVLADLLGKRLAERRVTVLTATTARDVVMGATGPRWVETDAGQVPAERVVVAVDPRQLPALAPYVARTEPVPPPTVTHLGLAGLVPDLPREVVFHGEGLLTVHPDGTAPAGKAAWTVTARGKVAGDVLGSLARRGLDVRDAVDTRLDRSPADQLAHWSGSPSGVRWRGAASFRDRLTTRTPLPHVYAAGAHTGAGGWLPFVVLSAAQVAEAVGPA